jgi:hypothetical protein
MEKGLAAIREFLFNLVDLPCREHGPVEIQNLLCCHISHLDHPWICAKEVGGGIVASFTN